MKFSNKEIIKVSTPIMLSLLAQSLIQIIDTAFLGRVGEVELGASAIAGIFYMTLFTIGFGFSLGAQILIGRRNGEGNHTIIGSIVTQGACFLLVLAMVLVPLTLFLSRTYLASFFESKAVLTAVEDYLDWRMFGLFFSFVNTIFRAFYVGITKTKVLTYNAFAMALVNVFFDYVLIFGNLGFPEMGIAGAALASVIAEAFSLLFFLVLFFKTTDLKLYGFLNIQFQFKVVKSILNLSIFMMIQYFLAFGAWVVFFIFIERMGEQELAISNIIRSFYVIFIIPSFALGAAINTFVSNAIGAGEQKAIPSLLNRAAKMSFLCSLVIILLASLFPHTLISIYTNDVELIAKTVNPLYVLLSALPFLAVGSVFFNAISGSGNTKMALILEVVTLVIYVTYIWWMVSVRQSSLELCWTTEHVYWGVLLLCSLFYMKRMNWKGKEI